MLSQNHQKHLIKIIANTLKQSKIYENDEKNEHISETYLLTMDSSDI